jgi:hypothetical protein
MTKKQNTIVFILAGTVFNIVVTMGLIFGLSALYGGLLAPLLAKDVVPYGLIAIIIGSFVAAYFIYNGSVKLLMRKIDFDKHFDPLFRPGPKKRP